MASFDGMKIPPEQREYIKTELEPLLEDMVTECLTDQPPDPTAFLVQWLSEQCGCKPMTEKELILENERLQKEINTLKGSHKQISEAITQEKYQNPGADSESEEDDDDDELMDEPPPIAERKVRTSVSAEAYGEWNQVREFTPPVHPKNDEAKARLTDALSRQFMFAGLDEKSTAIIVDAMFEVTLSAGQRVINQGETGDYLFVVDSGSVECLLKKEGEEKCVKVVKKGDVFGELSLLYNLPRAASVQATELSVCWRLDRETFNNIVRTAATEKRERNMAVLKKVPLLAAMDPYELGQLSDALMSETVLPGVAIVEQGDTNANKFYFLENGTAVAKKDGRDVMNYVEGSFFGELALLKNEPRAATVEATTKCQLLSLERAAFNRLLGGVGSMLTVKYS